MFGILIKEHRPPQIIDLIYYLSSQQARSQKVLLGNAFEVDLLMLHPSSEAVKEFIIVWCMLIAHIHEGLCLYFFKKCILFMCPS